MSLALHRQNMLSAQVPQPTHSQVGKPEETIYWPYLRMIGQIVVKQKVHQLDTIPTIWLYGLDLWPHPWTWPWIFKVRLWNRHISGMGGPKGCESIIHDHDFWETMVGCLDVLNWDWIYFRCHYIVDVGIPPILTQIGCFWTVTPVWIHWWLQNDAQNFK